MSNASPQRISENRDGSKASAHYLRAILTAAKPPEEFRQDFDPIDGTPTTPPDLTQKQAEDLQRFKQKFPNEPQLHVTPKGTISRKRGKR